MHVYKYIYINSRLITFCMKPLDLKGGVGVLSCRASPPVLVGVTSLPMILLRGEGFGVSSTIFYGHMVLLLTSYLATVARCQKVAIMAPVSTTEVKCKEILKKG